PAVADVPGKDHQAPSSSRVRVLVAHSDPAVCQTIGAVVAAEGLECRQCHDGDSALAQMHSWKPQVAMVDVALPGLYAFEVVEKVQSLSVQDRPGIILISSVYNRTAYKRKPADLYGADDYIELHHIPDDLVPKIRALLDGRQPPAVRPPKSEQERAQWASVNAELKKAGERQIEGGDVRDRARQLARIIASDIALYHHDKLSLARAGEALETCFAAEIEEAVRLFLDRFPGHEDLARQLVTETLQDLVQGHLHPS
ncbi:MAG: response regulator, partial [Deltaproteobacteria bacterium]